VKGKRENGKIGKAKEEKIGIREMGNGEMQREVKPPRARILATALPTFKVVLPRHFCLPISLLFKLH